FKLIRTHKIDAFLAVGLFVFALIPRIIGLGTFLTADEKTWIGRSYEFVRAFHDLRFNDMLQTTHPGVTTLWISGLAVMFKSATSHISYADINLIYFVKITQFSIAFLNSLAIPAIFILLLLVFKNRFLAVLSTLFIAFDPFIIGYSRVVHVDVLMGSFLTLAVLATILYAQTLKRSWLIASAVLSILAILTKVPAIFIMPFLLMSLAIYHPKAILTWSFIKDRIRDALVWILMGLVITLLIWPALLWVPNPSGNVLELKRDVVAAAVTPHDSELDYNLDPMHYPYALLDRSNPVTFVFGIIGIIAVIILIHKKKMPKEMVLMIVYLFGFIAMMTLGAKKGDRYIITVFFAVDVLAAYGVMWFASVIPDLIRDPRRIRLDSRFRGNDKLIAFACIVYLMFIVASYHPYEIAYSNPFFKDNLSQELGWGEGLDQVAAWLNKNHPNAVVASWYPEELAAFTSATVLHIQSATQNPVSYIVLYQNMFGRDPAYYSNDFIDEYFKKQNPVYVVKVAGKEYVWVYAKPSYSSTIGDLDSSLIAVQEISIDHEGVAGFQFLPATHFGQSDQGVFSISVSKTITGPSIYSTTIPLNDTKDTMWQQVLFPDSLQLSKGEHVFITVRGIGTAKPYPSIRYSQTNYRSTPIYLSRTGTVTDAKPKAGSLAIQMLFHGTDGNIATELEEKLLK
ncbi:MAG TPA: hypothetical protein VLG69_01845, partial [Candidatus Andersenbacteria bacterium]|nr:hypothetical protein [Candidatus Andersenbacteria bacterium]